MRYVLSLVVLLVVTVVGVGSLFWIQNASRTTQLSLDLWFAAWQLSQPVQVPTLIGISFAVGLALGALAFAVPSARNARKARRLEQELALSGGSLRGDGTGHDGWRG